MAGQNEWWKNGGKAPVPTPQESQAMAGGLGQVMSVISEAMVPVYDATDGVRAQMKARGYTDEAAEAAAMIFLQNAMNNLWAGQ